jgi:CheY-like chemotaxis protein
MAVKKVLIIEFNALEANAIADGLYKKGYGTLIATTGHDGLRVAFEEKPDLVILNLLMPDLQGAEIIERLRDIGDDLPVIAINQLARADSGIAKKMGATDQISKPIAHDRLAEMVKHYAGESIVPTGSRPPRPSLARTQRKRSADAEEEGVPVKGSFKFTPFHQLLAKAFRHHETGILTVKDALGEVIVTFVDGLPSHVKSEGLARRLARDKRISDEKAREIRRLAATKDISEPEAARELEALAPSDLEDAVRGFHFATLRDLCRPSQERFTWEPRDDIDQVECIDPAVVIMLGARRHFPPEKIDQPLEAKGRMERPLRLADDPARLPDHETNGIMRIVLEAARCETVLIDVLSGGDQDEDRVRAMVYALAVLKAVTFNEAERWTAPAPPPPPKPEPARGPATPPPRPTPEPEAENQKPLRGLPETVAERSDRLDVRPAAAPTPEPEAVTTEHPAAAEPTSSEPLSDRQLLRIGKQLLKSRTFSKAQKCFKELIVRRGLEPQLLLYLAQSVSRNRFMDPIDSLMDGVDALRRALDIDPHFTEARLELARIFEDQGELGLAAKEMETALAFEPSNNDAQRGLRSLNRRLAAAAPAEE